MRISRLLAELRQRPLSILIVGALLTWLYLMVSPWLFSGHEYVITSHMIDGGHGHHHHHINSPSVIDQVFNIHWVLMLIAMMLPLHADAIKYVWGKNFPNKRYISILCFWVGYIIVWSIVGLISYAFMSGLEQLYGENSLITLLIFLFLLVVWQASPWKQRSLNRCGFIPVIYPFGWRAFKDSFVYGLKKAGWCVGSCWALMLVSLFLMESSMWMMPLFTVIMFTEQILPLRKEQWHWPFNPLVWR